MIMGPGQIEKRGTHLHARSQMQHKQAHGTEPPLLMCGAAATMGSSHALSGRSRLGMQRHAPAPEAR